MKTKDQTISLSLVSHTNVGKTTLARTLLNRNVGVVRDEPLMSPYLLRTYDPSAPRPMRFLVRQAVERYAQSVGLMARQTSWSVKES